jgi:hypothetical protein
MAYAYTYAWSKKTPNLRKSSVRYTIGTTGIVNRPCESLNWRPCPSGQSQNAAWAVDAKVVYQISQINQREPSTRLVVIGLSCSTKQKSRDATNESISGSMYPDDVIVYAITDRSGLFLINTLTHCFLILLVHSYWFFIGSFFSQSISRGTIKRKYGICISIVRTCCCGPLGFGSR